MVLIEYALYSGSTRKLDSGQETHKKTGTLLPANVHNLARSGARSMIVQTVFEIVRCASRLSALIRVPIAIRVVLASALGLLPFSASVAHADEIRVAVSSNFAEPISEIARYFEKRTGHTVAVAVGSTGRHYAQIHNGAKFDAFFSADVEHATLLEREKIAVADSRFTYAIGKVVLWSPKPGVVDSAGKILEKGSFPHLAIANPDLAPYGKAAAEVLRARGLWQSLEPRLVRGENIGQAYQFIESGAAELGFVAYSQVRRADGTVSGSFWLPPTSMYQPIEQQAVLLTNSVAGSEFLSFVKSAAARRIILTYGYDTP